MTHADAVEFLSHARPAPGFWADVGAGTGTFTRALAELIGHTGTVFAIDRDADALRRAEQSTDRRRARIVHVRGDMTDLALIRELDGVMLTGALFANALHFTARPDRVLDMAAGRLTPDGRIVVIEYDRDEPNPWVPHPLPFSSLSEVAREAGLAEPRRVAERPSRYHRTMYCAVMRAGRDPGGADVHGGRHA
ncbi:MAG TPA: methyltransferase domain-containing protein [Longimicrobiales bacterium]